MKACSTWCSLANGDYPRLWIRWTQDEDTLGYTGVAQAWKDGYTKDGREHTVTVRLGTPVGYGLHLAFDPFGAGAWDFVTAKACNELNPGILDLVNAWACACWKRLQDTFPDEPSATVDRGDRQMKKQAHKHNFAYPHSIWQGRTSNEIVVGRYCASCGLQQAARASKWGKVPKSHPDMKRALQY